MENIKIISKLVPKVAELIFLSLNIDENYSSLNANLYVIQIIANTDKLADKFAYSDKEP